MSQIRGLFAKLFKKGNRFAFACPFTVLTMPRRAAPEAGIAENPASLLLKNGMNDDPLPAWQARLEALRVRKKLPGIADGLRADTGEEALMTLRAIMREEEDPKLQIAAAKALLGHAPKIAATAAKGGETDEPTFDPDDLDAIVSVAKALLDELAARKTGGISGTGALASEGAAKPDHP